MSSGPQPAPCCLSPVHKVRVICSPCCCNRLVPVTLMAYIRSLFSPLAAIMDSHCSITMWLFCPPCTCRYPPARRHLLFHSTPTTYLHRPYPVCILPHYHSWRDTLGHHSRSCQTSVLTHRCFWYTCMHDKVIGCT